MPSLSALPGPTAITVITSYSIHYTKLYDLAKADESVRMAAKERMGMALEGKGDEAGAVAAYKELAGRNNFV